MSSPALRHRRLAGAVGLAVAVASLVPAYAVAAPALTTAAPDAAPGVTDVQIIGTNDYHGRLAAGPRLAAQVNAFRQANPNTVFAAAGDLVGATTFESFIQHDKPTIDVMNAAGLDVSAVGNHEFDAGYDDLTDRIMAPFDAVTNPEGGAEWEYLGANVKMKSDGSDALEPSWIKDFGTVQVGFVGAVTEDLPSLVAASGIADITVTNIVDATNAEAADLRSAGADVVVLLVHEGAATPQLASTTNPSSVFGKIVNGVSADVDAIISGHTHQAYNHSIPVPAWVAEGRAVTERPVVSAGQYGENLNQLVFSVDNTTGDVTAKTQSIVAAAAYPAQGDTGVQTIVDQASTLAATLGARPLGKLAAGFSRAKFADGTSENRGGESTLNNLVAEVQRWAADAQIGFMNPGGLRADMMGTGTTYPRTLTYKNAADVQPFANTIMKMDLTGASLKKVLEQQWQRNASGQVPSRPFLKLGTSEGFSYTYDPARAEGDRITGMWLNGAEVDPAATYSVAANSFLASGTGDNFFAFAEATNKRDSGQVDLAAMVDYATQYATDAAPLGVDAAQGAVGVTKLAADYARGETVSLKVSSLAMTGPSDVPDTALTGTINGVTVGPFPVTTTIPTAGDANSSDEAGTADVTFALPSARPGKTYPLVLTGNLTGTRFTVPITVSSSTTVTAAARGPVKAQSESAVVDVTVTAPSGTPTGLVTAWSGGQVVGAGNLAAGKVALTLAPFATAGTKQVEVRYAGDAASRPAVASTTVVVGEAPVVAKNAASVTSTATPASVTVGSGTTLAVQVGAKGATPTGVVLASVGDAIVGAGELKDGRTSIEVASLSTVGTAKVHLRYLGDTATAAATADQSVEVVRAESTLKLKAPKKAVAGKKAALVLTVTSTGAEPTGTVTVTVSLKGKTIKVTRKVVGGSVTIKVPLRKAGVAKVAATYSGDAATDGSSAKGKIKVTRKRR